MGWALLQGISRVFAGVHYTSDIIGSAVLAGRLRRTGAFITKIAKIIPTVGLCLYRSGRYTETKIKIPAKKKE